jgi:hypothetical protein
LSETLSDALLSVVDFESDGFRPSEGGSGFLACSALNPGGGSGVPELDDVEGSVEYSRC